DLYAPPSPGADSGPLGGAASGPGLGGDSQGRFSLEDDAHSQLLDADGFLNVGQRPGAPPSHKRQLVLDRASGPPMGMSCLGCALECFPRLQLRGRNSLITPWTSCWDCVQGNSPVKVKSETNSVNCFKSEPPAANQTEQKTSAALNPFQKPSQPVQVRRGSLLSQPQAVLQKLANISDGNPLAPRNTRGFLFQTLSPEKVKAASNGPQNQVVRKRSQVEVVNPAAKRPCRGTQPAGHTKNSQRSIFSFLDH
ncbi:hypothetical protein XENOCAPTIV_027321, partial [Xenoophorus captivus]